MILMLKYKKGVSSGGISLLAPSHILVIEGW